MKSNRLFILISFIFIMAIFLSMGVATVSSSSCNPSIQIVSQDPSPAIPDSYVNMVFEVSSFDGCNGLSVKLDPEYPFSLDPNATSIQTIKESFYVSGYNSAWTVPYKIRVDSDALEGDYQLKLLYHDGNSDDFESFAVEKDFNIPITDAQTDFDVVVQDTSGGQVSLGIVNIGKNTANSLIVGIPQQDNFRTTGTSEQIVGNLASGDYTIVSFNIASTRAVRNVTRMAGGAPQQFNSSIDNQLLKVQIDYTDGIGERRNVTKEIPFNNIATQGNLTSTRITGTGRYGSASSGVSKWWYVLIVVILIAAGIIVYRKYGDKIRGYWKKDADKVGKKISKNIPDWVLAEKTRRK